MYVSGKNIKRYCKEQPPDIQGTAAADLSTIPTAQPLKCLTDKTIWIEQQPLTSEKLQALEQLVQEQLSARHIEELAGPLNSPIFVVKKKMENGNRPKSY